MSVCFITPYIPLLYGKTRVDRGIHYFLFFSLRHILWVLIRTASMRRFQRVPTIYVLSKNMKIVKNNHLKIVIFIAIKIAVYCMGMFSLWKETRRAMQILFKTLFFVSDLNNTKTRLIDVIYCNFSQLQK